VALEGLGRRRNGPRDIIELVERIYNVDFPEALRILLSREYPVEYYKRESEIEKRDRDAKIAYARRLYASSSR